MSRCCAPLLVRPSLQRYAWGDPRALPALLGLPETGEPLAEAWYGAHPAAPATVLRDRDGDGVDGDARGLDAVVAAEAEGLLGARVWREFRGLPYLLKLLSARFPLSIQVHPGRAQAAAGFAREAGRPAEARSYRDAGHKPELLVAHTPFFALYGFRSPAGIADALGALPELSALMPAYDGTAAGLWRLLEAYFALPDARLQPALMALLARLRAADAHKAFGKADAAYWALRAQAYLEREGAAGVDRGLLMVFLMALIQLAPGEGIFVPAGVPHAYLEGVGIELMASSDNVLRAGLTRKRVDVAELLRLLRTDALAPPRIHAVDTAPYEAAPPGSSAPVSSAPVSSAPVSSAPVLSAPVSTPRERVYPTPAAEFELRSVALGEAAVDFVAEGPETLLALPAVGATEAAIEVRADGQPVLRLGSGQACLIPHGTRYRVAGRGRVFRAVVPSEAVGPFRGRRPTELRFGTSGLRGLVADMSDLEVYVNTRGFIDDQLETGDAVYGMPVALGGDLRPSTGGILRAVAQAVVDSGLRVVHCGRLPTPALTSFAIEQGWPSIMVTGSHIPFDRNGIKFNRRAGEVLKADEARILRAVARVRRRVYAAAGEGSPFDDSGAFVPGAAGPLPPAVPDAAEAYRARYAHAFAADALAGLRVGLYQHSAVGRDLLADILRDLGAEVVPLGRTEHFVAVDTEAISAAELARLSEMADGQRAGGQRLDALVSTDGDSDRPLFCGFDRAGQLSFIPGGTLGAVVAARLGVDSIAVPITVSDMVERYFEPTAEAGAGARVVRTKIGSPYVIAAMQQAEGARVVGWEANGGFLLGTKLALPDGPIAPLPTRDAVLPIVVGLLALKEAGDTDAMLAPFPPRATRAGLLDAVPPTLSRAVLARLHVRGVESARFDNDGVYAVEADRERRLEGGIAERLLAIRGDLTRCFPSSSEVVFIDLRDGVYIRFADGDVVHLRPSGNAPQLRVYTMADTDARAEARQKEGEAVARRLVKEAEAAADFVSAVKRNIEHAEALFSAGQPPAVLGTVCGSAPAQRFWQQRLEQAKKAFGAEYALSLHEDLPVGQALGLLLMWERIRGHVRAGQGALMAFVFGEGSRAAPFTEAEMGQKPAIASFVRAAGSGAHFLSVVEVALRYFAPVEAFLRRSGFDGVVVKWGDEIQIPTLDLGGKDARFDQADIVRFVSMREITAEDAAHKDWVGVGDAGEVVAFIPRRPLSEMEALADRGLLTRRGGKLYGGINLGSIAVSRALLDRLLEAFRAEVHDTKATRASRPDLDPQFFSALTVAAIADADARAASWARAQAMSPAMARLAATWPDLLARLRRVLDGLERARARPLRMVAMDVGDQYWGDLGQHGQMRAFYTALREDTPSGAVARALAGIDGARLDEHGNILAGHTRLGPGVRVSGSVLLDAHIREGDIRDSVLIGTRCGALRADRAFDVASTAVELELAPQSGSYKVVSEAKVTLPEGGRATTVFLPGGAHLLRAHEALDLRDKARNYDRPVGDNPVSFRQAHKLAVAADPDQIDADRAAARRKVETAIDRRFP